MNGRKDGWMNGWRDGWMEGVDHGKLIKKSRRKTGLTYKKKIEQIIK